MNRTLLQMQMLYNKMGKSEKKIADWLMQHPHDILPLSITELAEQCSSSEATIVRFAKRLGFLGYQGLKISIAQESDRKLVSHDISSDDSCIDIFDKISNDIYCSLEMTKHTLDGEALENAAKEILVAEYVYIFGLGNSSSVALDAAHKFMRAGCSAFAYSDNHMQAIAASHMSECDIAIGISHSGSSKDIVDTLETAKRSGAKTMCITNRGKSPIVKCSDIALFTSSSETEYSILGLNSRIAALAIIDSLYAYLVSHGGEKAEKSIMNVENALKNKKF